MAAPSSRRVSALPPEGAAEFIRANLPLTEVPGTGLRLHLHGRFSGRLARRNLRSAVARRGGIRVHRSPVL